VCKIPTAMFAKKIYEAGDEDGLCLYCRTKPCILVAVPCGHRYACNTCVERYVKMPKCAVCRDELTHFMTPTDLNKCWSTSEKISSL